MNPVSHLHFHSDYSLQDSVIKIDQLPELIKEKNCRAIALTDHGSVDGAIRFYTKLKDIKDFIPLIGCEFYVVDDCHDKSDRLRYHMTVIAKNRDGFTSIMKALTVANLEGFYYRPRIDFPYIFENFDPKDVVIMTACTASMVYNHYEKGDQLVRFLDKFYGSFYLEAILLTDYKPSEEHIREVISDAETHGLDVAFTNDVHLPEKSDWPAREIHRAIQYNLHIDPKTYEEKTEDVTADIYFKTYDEMVGSLKHFGFERYEQKMVKVWDKIVKECGIHEDCDHGRWLKPEKVAVPIAYDEAREDPDAYFRKICWEAFDKKMPDGSEEARKRVEYELKQICDECEFSFAEYFLLVRDLVVKARERGIMVGPGRGSVGGSLIAYLLEITDVNPLDYGLIFERFISPGRHDLPDIDLDFEDTRRGDAIEYLEEKYQEGEDECKVAMVSTFMAMKGRGVIRDVGRVFNVPLADVNEVAKQVLVRSGGDARASFSLEDTVSLFEVAKKFNKEYPWAVKEAKKLEGVLKNRGVHAAGVVVDTEDLYSGRKCVLVKNRSGEKTINWDKKDLEYMGLMKIDILGLRTLSILHIVQEMVKARNGEEIDWNKLIPLDEEGEEEVLEMFRQGETLGVFQLGSSGMMQYLRDFQPKNFRELYQVNSLYRPGTLRSGMAMEFISRKNGEKKVDYVNDKLKSILENTYGVVLFQEQIMFILNRLGNVPWRNADVIRKVVSKSEGEEKFESFRMEFVEGAEELGEITRVDAGKIFDLMKYFGSYGFNLSHAVEYTILSYWTAWAKVHYPLEFYCANLRREPDKDVISALLTDVGKQGIAVELPNINKSKINWVVESVEGKGILRAGFDIIKGISAKLSETMIKAREEAGGEWESFKQFHESVPKRLVNIARVKSLLLADAFGDWFTEEERKKMIIYIERERKVPTDMEVLKDIEASEFENTDAATQEIYNYELAEAFFSQNKRFIKEIIERSLENNYDTERRKLEFVKEMTEKDIEGSEWFIGKFDEIKFGYRAAVDKTKDLTDGESYKGNLGGVYGLFRDDTFLYYTTFGSALYRSNLKAEIEDAAGKYVLIKAHKPLRGTNLFAQEIYFLDEMKSGIFKRIKAKEKGGEKEYNLDLSGLIHWDGNDHADLQEEIRECAACPGRAQCVRPTPFSPGGFNAMIIGQDPGAEEEEEGVPFVGASGKLFWRAMEKVTDLSRELIHVTNLQKCRPRQNIYNDNNSQKCREIWLEREMKLIQPRVILSLGSPACRFLTNNRSAKITKFENTAAWSERYQAWIVYSMHPSYYLRDANKDQTKMEESLKKFERIMMKLI